ncbi:MAG TPA: hypothetical protein VMV46_02300 [Thermoanaerobaculia bacterium]|nr:hypothetical protein [Thermoanaerobaculia bacterium]
MNRPSSRRESGLHGVALAVGLAALVLPAPGAALIAGGGETVAVCLTNSLDEPITYEYRWGTGPWGWDLLEVDAEVEHRLDLDPRQGGVPWLQVRYRRSFGEQGMRTVLRATPVADELECEPIFAVPGPEELAAQREENLRSARERWHEAASGADLEVSSAIDLYFEVSRKERSVVRVWKLGEVRPVVLGRISELREGARKTPVALWGEGRYLVEIFEEVELARVDSFVLDAKEIPEITRLTPRLGSP